MAARVLALEALVKITGVWTDAKQDVRLESAAAKVLATEWMLESLLDLFRLYGGRAFETPDSLRLRGEIPVPIERMIRDALINVIWEGTNGILSLWIGREGLEEYFKQGKAFLDLQIKEMLSATPFFLKIVSRSLTTLSSRKKKAFETNGAAQGPYDAWERFVEQKGRELARKTLLITAHHRQRLAPKQLLMKRLVQASMNLFAMEAMLWYGSQKEIQEREMSQSLLTYFCSRVKEEFEPTPLLSLRTSFWNDDTTVYCLAKDILSGKAEWLEDGIVKLPLL
jgi:alkylation response protein AidB-like acyl-CoA dehydrogenase